MENFRAERQRIAGEMAEAQKEEARLLREVDRLTTDLTRVRARIASLKAEDHTYATAGSPPTAVSNGDLSRMTIQEAILTVLTEAKPEAVQKRDLERTMAARGKLVSSGVSVDLTSMKQNGKVLNPKWGYWTVP